MPCTWVMACAYAPSGCAVACGWASYHMWWSKCVICLVFCLFFMLNWGYFLVTGAWIINAQCILCLWTRMRTWLPRRSRWPCTQTTCQPAASLTRTCRWEYGPQLSKMFIEIIDGEIVHLFPRYYRHFRFLAAFLFITISLSLLIRNHSLLYSSAWCSPTLLIIHSSQLLLVWCPGHMMFHTAKTIHL